MVVRLCTSGGYEKSKTLGVGCSEFGDDEDGKARVMKPGNSGGIMKEKVAENKKQLCGALVEN